MQDTAQFRLELKQNLVEWLNLEDIQPEDIQDDQPIFKTGLGLDSLDGVEIAIMLQRKYGVLPASIENADKKVIFATFASLADFVQENRQEK